MQTFKKTLLGILIISLITFIALFGRLPGLRRTPIGWLYRALCLHLPNGLKAVDRRATAGGLTSRSKKLGHYLFYEKNPVVLIAFLLLLTGSATLFLWNAVDRLPINLILPLPLVFIPPYYFTYLCVTCKNHLIDKSNHHQRLHDYPFDQILFRPNTTCSTCNLLKPARSKHCSLCGHCVAKCDHHCPWVNNCLGRGNYRYFLALLLSLGILQVYGAYLSYWILAPYFTISTTESMFSSEWMSDFGDAVVIAVNEGGISIAGVGLLAATTTALPLVLFGYHCYLIWAGMTTNESSKWADWRDDMADGCVFKTSRDTLLNYTRLRQRGVGGAQSNGGSTPKGLAYDLGITEEESLVSWPIESDQVLVRTSDGKPPQGQEALWKRVWSLREVENVYDLGGWRNFVEVLKGR